MCNICSIMSYERCIGIFASSFSFIHLVTPMLIQNSPVHLSLEGKGGRGYVENPSTEYNDYFILRTANEWMKLAKLQPIPRRLFGDLWFEGEICILFADTNVGKSILAVQIADRISRGVVSSQSSVASEERIPLTTDKPQLITECEAQKVVYFDFELSSQQFASRVSEEAEGSGSYRNYYEFHPNFFRAEFNPDFADVDISSSFNEFLNDEIEKAIVSSGAKVVIVDNLTWLSDDTEASVNALRLMKFLKRIKSKLGLSILALAHTPKRDEWMPICRNDLQGSKMLINFCDSSFAIGESKRVQGLRYIKQIKARNVEISFDADNVLLAKIVKPGNFLHFEFLNTAFESDHIRFQRDWMRQELLPEVIRLKALGFSTREIGAELSISAMSVSRYLKTVTPAPG